MESPSRPQIYGNGGSPCKKTGYRTSYSIDNITLYLWLQEGGEALEKTTNDVSELMKVKI